MWLIFRVREPASRSWRCTHSLTCLQSLTSWTHTFRIDASCQILMQHDHRRFGWQVNLGESCMGICDGVIPSHFSTVQHVFPSSARPLRQQADGCSCAMLINAVHGTGVLSTSACQGVVMSARSCVNRRINLVLRLVSSSNIACASSIAGLRDDNPLLVPAPLSSGVDCVESALQEASLRFV